MAAVAGTLGAQMYLSSIALSAAFAGTSTAFAALASNSRPIREIGLIQSFGNFGKVFEVVTFVAVATGRTQKFKGPYNAGSIQVTFGQDLTDTGQVLLYSVGNAANQNAYPFKITLVGAATTKDTVYFGGKVMGYQSQMGQANSVLMAQTTIEVDTDVFFMSA